MRIVLIGCGGVGQAFVKLVEDKQQFLAAKGLPLQITHIIDLANSDDFMPLLSSKTVDLAVLATPTNKESGEPGYSYIKAALSHGLHVVTADKGPVLLAYHELKELAAANGVKLGIGCTTSGALPAINGGLLDLAGAAIHSIEGVLNGTTNFILEEMREKQKSYAEALSEAQQLGIAETDPSLDVEGWDTAIKLLILTNALLGEHKRLADIEVRGITALTPADIEQAARAGLRYRLVGKSAYEQGQLVMKVEPLALDPAHPFYQAEGTNKAVRYISDTLGELTISGGASSVRAAAAALLRDIVNMQSSIF
jgi:homoserine dehydrogenase